MGIENLTSPENQENEVNATVEYISTETEKLKKEVINVNENKEIEKDIKSTFKTAEADIDNNTQTQIDTDIKMVNGETITETSINISAGADQRIMNLERAKTIFNKKKDILKQTKNKFAKSTNKTAIETIINELSSENIKKNIIDKNTDSKTNTEQHGNRYLIAARIAEGFIQVLNKLSKEDKEPNLTLTIDWDKCLIGIENKDIEGDRFINIALTMKVEEGEGTNGNVVVGAEGEQKVINAVIINNGTNTIGEGDIVTNEYNGAAGNGSGPNGDKLENEIKKDDDKKVIKEGEKEIKKEINTIPDVETPEIISLKKEIAEHFTIEENPINRAIDISNDIVVDKGIYTLHIAGYRGLQFKHDQMKKTIELLTDNEGSVKKGLLLYNITGTSISTEGEENVDIAPTFNDTKTIEAINGQLISNDKDGNGKPDYKVTKIQDKELTFEYNVNFIKDKSDKTKTKSDTYTITLDNNNLIMPDSQEPGQISQRKKTGGTIEQDKEGGFKIENGYTLESGKKIIYYTQTKGTNNRAELIITNNIQKTILEGYESIYPEHKEITDPEFESIRQDFLTNKIERIFIGTLKKSHNTDFQNNRKITKQNNNKYNFEITFTKNDGTQEKIDIPFIKTVNSETNTNEYVFTTNTKEHYIDNIAYDITVPSGFSEVPSITMSENREKTLDKAEKKTNKQVYSDIFGGQETQRANNGKTYTVKAPAFSLGDISFTDTGGYKRTIILGEKKDGDNIILAGEDKGIIYYDQDYKIIKVEMNKSNNQKEELDFGNPEIQTGIEKVAEDEDSSPKGIILTPKIEKDSNNKSVLRLDFKEPDETDKYRQEKDLYLERIREEKEIIFTALKNLSTTLTDDIFNLPNIDTNDETRYIKTKIQGPNAQGLYQRKIVDASKDKNNEYLEQNIYCKVEGKNIVLCNSDGEKIDNTYIIDHTTEDYYEITTKNEKFIPTKLDQAEIAQKILHLSTQPISYKNDKIDIAVNSNTIELLESNLTDRYVFASDDHKMCTIELEEEEISDKSLTQTNNVGVIIDENKSKYGSYTKYFAGEGREYLGIGESDYEEAIKEIYTEYSNQDDTKDIIQVKLWSKTDGKYYFDYMSINKDGNKGFKLEKLNGREEAKQEMKRRLDNLVLLDKMQISPKGDMLRGVKINNKDYTSRITYLTDKDTPIKMTLTDTNNQSTDPIHVYLRDNQKWELEDNEDIDLGGQNIDCELAFKDDIPFLKIEIKEQPSE